MNIVDRIQERQRELTERGSELINPLIQRFNETSKEWFTRGNDLLGELQERQVALLGRGQSALGEAMEASQKALLTFEELALTKSAAMLEWAYTASGEKSEAIRRSRDFITERLAELERQKAEMEESEAAECSREEAGTAEDTEQLAEVKYGAECEAEGDDLEAESEAESQVEVDGVEVPFEGYDELTVKEAIERLEDMDEGAMQAALRYEQANKNRKTLIESVERLLA